MSSNQASFNASLGGETAYFKVEGDVKGFLDSVDKTVLGTKRATKELESQAIAIEKNIQALKQGGKANQDQIKQQQALASSLRTAQKELRLQNSLLRETELAAKAAAKPIGSLKDELKGQAVAALGTGTAIGAVVTAVLALGAAAIQGVQAFGGFERTLNTIGAVSNATNKELNDIKQSAIDLGQSTIFTNQQVADSYLELAKAGFTAQESLAAMSGVLNTAAISGGDLAESAAVVAGTLRGFQKDASEAVHVSDLLATGANKSSADVSDLGQAMKVLAPVAYAAGQSLEDTTATLSVLANGMIKGADAGSDLRGILVRLIDPPKDAATALQALGVQVTDNAGKIRPLIDIVEDLQKALAKYNQQGQNKLIADIAGLENLKTLSTLVNTSTKDLEEMREGFKNVDGAGQAMADRINQGVVPAYQGFTGALETTSLTIGQAFAPAVANLLNALTDVIGVVNKLLPLLFDMLEPIGRLIGDFFNFTGEILKCGLALSPLGPVFGSFIDYLNQGAGPLANTAALILDIAKASDIAITSLQKLGVEAARGFAQAKNRIQFAGNASRLADVEGSTNDRYDKQIELIDAQYKNRNDNRTNALRKLYGAEGISKTGGINRSRNQSYGNLSYLGGSASGKSKKAKAARDKTSQIEQKQISIGGDSLRDANSLLSAQSQLDIARLGNAKPDQDNAQSLKKLDIEQNTLTKQRDNIIAFQKSLAAATYKTSDAQLKQKETLKDLAKELIQNDTALQNNTNERDKVRQAIEEQDKATKEFFRNIDEEKRQLEEDSSIDELKAETAVKAESIKKQYDQGKISAQEFADQQKQLIEDIANAERAIIDRRIANLENELSLLDDTVDSQKKRAQIELQINQLQADRTKNANDEKRSKGQVDQDAQNQGEQIASNLKSSFRSAVSQAVKDAFSGQGAGNALKKFGLALKDILVNTLADAIGSVLGKITNGLFDKIGTALGDLITKGVSTTGLTGKGAALGALGVAGAIGGTLLAGGSKSPLQAGGGVALGAGGGALAGAIAGSIVPGLGTVAGGILGGLAGGSSAAVSNASKGGFFSTKAGVATAFALGGPLGFLALGASNSARISKRQKETAKNEAKNTDYANQILAAADVNNLFDLQAKKSQIEQELYSQTRRGKTGKAPLNAAIAQLTQAIADREKAIAQAIKEFDSQSKDLTFELKKLKEPYNLAVEAQQAMSQLADDTAKLLDQFKDSEEAKTKILQIEAQKREILAEEEKKTFEDQANALNDLLKQRDAIENSNVYQRSKSNEQTKADSLADIDKQIAQNIVGLQSLINNGAQLPNVEGINKLLDLVKNTSVTANIQVNGAQDPEKVGEEVARQIQELMARQFGATVV